MNQRVLVMIPSSVGPRLDGVARYAREHGWHLMIQDRLGRWPDGFAGGAWPKTDPTGRGFGGMIE